MCASGLSIGLDGRSDSCCEWGCRFLFTVVVGGLADGKWDTVQKEEWRDRKNSRKGS